VAGQESARGAVSASAILESVQLLAAQDPEAFGELVVEILCKLAELDCDAYEFLVGGMVSRELQGAGFVVALEQAKRSLALGNPGQAAERMNAMGLWVRSIEDLGSRERLGFLPAEKPKGGPASPHYVM